MPIRGPMQPVSLAVGTIEGATGSGVRAHSPARRRPDWVACWAMGKAARRGWAGPLAAAVAAAQGGVLVLRPHDGVIAARPVDPLEHFDAEQIARARRYAYGQLALGAAGAATEGALLVWLVGRERRARGRSDDGDGGLARAGADGAALALALTALPLPFGALMRKRALDAG